MSHLLTFIIPCHNRKEMIKEAIDSIYQQNLSIPFEVIVTDDHSSDGSVQTLQAYQKKYSNFCFYLHDKNGGPSVARNTCVRHSKGDLIFNLDSDNFLEPNTVMKLVELLDRKNCEGAAFAAARVFRRVGGKCVSKSSISYIKLSEGDICDLAQFMRTSRTPPSQGNYLFTRNSFDLAGSYPEGREGSPEGALETYRFGFRQLLTGTKIAVLPDSFYWHRASNDSKWRRDHSIGHNDKIAVAELKKHPHLFTKETNQLLAEDETSIEGHFFGLLNGGRIKLK